METHEDTIFLNHPERKELIKYIHELHEAIDETYEILQARCRGYKPNINAAIYRLEKIKEQY